MKGMLITGLTLAALPLAAIAGNCVGFGGTIQNPSVLLPNATVCASKGTERWQEWHNADGSLWEWALGVGHPVDPTHQIGTWSATSSTVTYNYTGGSSYTFEIWQSSIFGTRAFCQLGADTGKVADISTILPGAGACPP